MAAARAFVRRERCCGHPRGYYAAYRANADLRAKPGFSERPAKRDDESMEGRTNERELYREILRRANRVREAASESL